MEGSIDLGQPRSPPEAVAPAEEALSSLSSGEDSVELKKDSPEVAAAPADRRAAGAALCSNVVRNSSVDVAGANISRVNTMPSDIWNSRKIEPPFLVERSKTERQRPSNIFAEVFDDRISVQQKNCYCQRWNCRI